jgi:hypothetical protein
VAPGPVASHSSPKPQPKPNPSSLYESPHGLPSGAQAP